MYHINEIVCEDVWVFATQSYMGVWMDLDKIGTQTMF